MKSSPVPDEDELVAEQREFYDADAEEFDEWLSGLLNESNVDAVAQTYRAGRARIAAAFQDRAPLGNTLELAAGGGRLAGLWIPHATSATLVDSSVKSVSIASRRLASTADVRFVTADIFALDGDGEKFDTIIFSAWLHHVPHSRFDSFWARVDGLLADDGVVIFDFVDSTAPPSGQTVIPEQPSDDYVFYAPVDGVSTRDHLGRRWKVVHHLWDPDDLAVRLSSLGWTMALLGPGLFGNVCWAEARRSR